jgi:hypothetical protein
LLFADASIDTTASNAAAQVAMERTCGA